MATPRQDIYDPKQGDYGSPIIQYPSPIVDNLIVVQDFPCNPSDYQPLPLYTEHPGNAEHGQGLFLVWQSQVVPRNDRYFVRRIYANRRVHQDVYNWAESFAEESVAHPIFIRSYLVRRDEYTPLAKGAPLSKVLNFSVTATGTGYTSAPTVSLSGGGGTGAAGTAFLYNGTVAGIFITNEGTGYTSAPSVSLTGGGGTGATATAYVQPSTAVLVKEDVQPAEDPYSGAFLRVTRIYETLPGPELESAFYDEIFGFTIKSTEQRIKTGTVELAAGMDLIPQSAHVELKRQIDLVDFGNQIEGIHIQIPTEEDIRLPPTLEEAIIYWGGQSSDGYSTVSPKWQAVGWYSGGLQAISFGGSASASATIDGDVAFILRDGYAGPAAAILHLFFLPLATASSSDILTKVGASPWPIFRPKSRNLVVRGRHQSLEVSGKIVMSYLAKPTTEAAPTSDPVVFVSTTKTGERRGGGVATKSVPIPAALCVGISVVEEGSSTQAATATIKREAPVVTAYDSDGDSVTPTIDEDYGTWPSAELSVEVEAEGDFAPSSIPATVPPVFPTGRYLTASKAAPFKNGWIQVTALTVDITSDMV